MLIVELLLLFPCPYIPFYYFSFSSLPYGEFLFTTVLDGNIQGFVNFLPSFLNPRVTSLE